MTNAPPKPPIPSRTLFGDTSTPETKQETPVHADESNSEEEVEIKSRLPGVSKSKMFFEMFIFNPEDSISKSALVEVLRASRLSMDRATFDKLSPEAKRHFLRLDRTGALTPYKPPRN